MFKLLYLETLFYIANLNLYKYNEVHALFLPLSHFYMQGRMSACCQIFLKTVSTISVVHI